jgi:hypothetical protein
MDFLPEPADPRFPNVRMIMNGDPITGDINGTCNRPHLDLVERTTFLFNEFKNFRDNVFENNILAGFQYEVSITSPGKNYVVGDFLSYNLPHSLWSISLRVTSVSPDGGVLSFEGVNIANVTTVVNVTDVDVADVVSAGSLYSPSGFGCKVSISSAVDKRYVLREVYASLCQALDLLRHDTLVNAGYVNYIGSQAWAASQPA